MVKGKVADALKAQRVQDKETENKIGDRRNFQQDKSIMDRERVTRDCKTF